MLLLEIDLHLQEIPTSLRDHSHSYGGDNGCLPLCTKLGTPPFYIKNAVTVLVKNQHVAEKTSGQPPLLPWSQAVRQGVAQEEHPGPCLFPFSSLPLPSSPLSSLLSPLLFSIIQVAISTRISAFVLPWLVRLCGDRRLMLCACHI